MNALASACDITDKKEHSFASLNFLRGLSAAAVLLSHSATFTGRGLPFLVYGVGGIAVDVFMLISGFLMMWHFNERRNLGEPWGHYKTCFKFYVRRFFRIAPLYYFMLVLVYLFYNGLNMLEAQNRQVIQPAYVAGPHDPTSSEPTLGHVLAHFTFGFGFIPQYAASTHLPDWSIGLEMQFYLFFPFLALLLVRSQFIWGSALLLLASGVSFQLFGVGTDAAPKIWGIFPYATLLPFKIGCFLAGMLLAAGFSEKTNPFKRAFLLLLALFVAGIYMRKFLLVCFLFAFYELAISYGTGMPALDNMVKQAKRTIEHRFFKYMADASYGVYLIHMPLLVLVVWLLTQVSSFVELSPLMRLFFCLAVMVPTVYALAFLAFKFIEAPGIALGRQIIKRLK